MSPRLVEDHAILPRQFQSNGLMVSSRFEENDDAAHVLGKSKVLEDFSGRLPVPPHDVVHESRRNAKVRGERSLGSELFHFFADHLSNLALVNDLHGSPFMDSRIMAGFHVVVS